MKDENTQELPEITEEHVTEEMKQAHEAMLKQMEALKEKYLSSVYRGSITGRQSINVAILAKLFEAVDKYPESRFGQILSTIGLVHADSVNPDCWEDEFYLESRELLKRLE